MTIDAQQHPQWVEVFDIADEETANKQGLETPPGKLSLDEQGRIDYMSAVPLERTQIQCGTKSSHLAKTDAALAPVVADLGLIPECAREYALTHKMHFRSSDTRASV